MIAYDPPTSGGHARIGAPIRTGARTLPCRIPCHDSCGHSASPIAVAAFRCIRGLTC